MPTPPGHLSVLVDGEAVVAAGFTANPEELRVRLDPARRALPLEVVTDLGEIQTAMAAYFDGDVAAIDVLTVQPHGTDYQRRVWTALRAVPAGTTVTYTQLASRAGNPAAVRAAGTACGRNLLAPIVPCHRIVRADGSLGGYFYGLEYKRWLLDHERRAAAIIPPAPAPGSRHRCAR